ncbi:ribonuclease H2 subunit B [Rhodamnia argentea]|uniref:Ribonuclease H2 subunit B n=1 Tax=Rhodamnia argentea TaxID=178133 RepID=A0A8B8QUJ6_9MYRT|nr:ribonuclease H2 subunit B [Rhodamnia argentea]
MKQPKTAKQLDDWLRKVSIFTSFAGEGQKSFENELVGRKQRNSPSNCTGFRERVGHFLSLRHPKSGKATCYLVVDEKLLELQWFKLPYGSWFLGDYVHKDGCLYTATPVDPVFIMLPLFEEAKMKKADDPGKFRQLDEILFINGYPGYQHLLAIAEKSMQVVCEVKEIGSTRFFRLDDTKVLAWLSNKVHRVKQTLSTLDKNYAARSEKEMLADAVSIMGEYLLDEPWLKNLCDSLKLNLGDVGEAAHKQNLQDGAETNDFGSPVALQGKSGTEKRASKVGRQVKKAKVETDSQNIKEMFTRASRRTR